MPIPASFCFSSLSHFYRCCRCCAWDSNLGTQNNGGRRRIHWTMAALGGSPGLVVMGRDSRPEGRGFKSLHRILDGHFSHTFVVKIVLFVWKRPKINEKEAGVGTFLKQKNYGGYKFSHGLLQCFLVKLFPVRFVVVMFHCWRISFAICWLDRLPACLPACLARFSCRSLTLSSG